MFVALVPPLLHSIRALAPRPHQHQSFIFFYCVASLLSWTISETFFVQASARLQLSPRSPLYCISRFRCFRVNQLMSSRFWAAKKKKKKKKSENKGQSVIFGYLYTRCNKVKRVHCAAPIIYNHWFCFSMFLSYIGKYCMNFVSVCSFHIKGNVLFICGQNGKSLNNDAVTFT